MVVATETQDKTVPKTQKTLFFTDDLIELAQAHADVVGTTFTRVVTAALLQYFFTGKPCFGPETEWVEFGGLLESKAVPIEKLPGHRLRATALAYERRALTMEKEGDKRGAKEVRDACVRPAEYWANDWDRWIREAGGGLKGLIEVSAKRSIVIGEPVPLERPASDRKTTGKSS